ncbi:ATP-binding protein [Bailinhaonella thermotolerans]|uniref:ATP-binding protein n=1 Tax=Bailinhaonella thermotolerans TaxID=1070861 RepID=UPI00192A5AAE|nr:ATPase [Bailinhaonella thermotolerans]
MSGDTTRRRTGNLPAETTSFVGRRAESAAAARLLGESRLVTLTGVGGVGKSRLALRIGADLRAAFPDGAWLVDLHGLRDPDMVPYAVADALGFHDHTSRPIVPALTGFLAHRRLLLIADSCEHLTVPVATLVDAFLDAAPGLTILATGRRPLDVPGERVLRVPPLGAEDGRLLLTHRAGPSRLRLTPAGQRVLTRLCDRLDGIPLAIELAAVQLRTTSPDELLDRLERRFQVLEDERDDAPARHRALRTAIGWSHELCEPRERLLWARLSVFSGSFDPAAAGFVCGDAEIPAERVRGLLDRLVELSILQRDGGRYRMLDTVAEYGREWLARLGEEDALRRRHREFYLRRVRRAEAAWSGPDQAGWYDTISQDHGNLRDALEFSLRDESGWRPALTMVASLWFFWGACGHLREGRHYLDRVLGLDLPGSVTRNKALWVAGWVAGLQGDVDAAAERAEQCRAAAAAQDDTAAAAYAVQVAGVADFMRGDLERATAEFAEAVERHRACGDLNPGLLGGMTQLAMTLSLRGRVPEAVAVLRECLSICDEYGEQWGRSYACYVLAVAERERGSLDAAWAQARVALRIKRQFNDVPGCVMCMELLAWVGAAQGDAGRAARLLGATRGMWREFGLPLFGSPFFSAEHQECVDSARARLGEREYDAAFAEGEAFEPAEAIAYALGDLRDRPLARNR